MPLAELGEVPGTPGWVYRVVAHDRVNRRVDNAHEVGGRVTFEYHVFANVADRAANAHPVLMVNHKAMLREHHLRQWQGPLGEYRHKSGLIVPRDDVETFLTSAPDAYRWREVGRSDRLNDRIARRRPWLAEGGKQLNPYIFESYYGHDEELDDQFDREEFFLDEGRQIETLIHRWVTEARRLGLDQQRVDWRGTVENLIVGASADDYRVADDGSGYTDTTSGASSKINVNSTASSRLNLAWRFLLVGIPNSPTVSATTFTGNVDSTFRDDFDAFMYFEAADTAAAFSDTASRHFINSGGVTLTTGTGNFNNIATGTGDVSTGWPSLVADAQEVFDRPGWATDGAIALGMLADSSGTANMDGQIQSYDGSTSLCARLDITFEAASPGVTDAGNIASAESVPSPQINQHIALGAAIASGESVPEPVVAAGALTITPSAAIASGESVSQPVVAGPISVSDLIASGESVPNPTVQPGAVTVSPDAAISSGESVPQPQVDLTIYPDPLASGESIPQPQLDLTIYPDALGSGESVLQPTVTPGAVTVSPDAISSGEAVFQPLITAPQSVSIDVVVASGESFFNPWLWVHDYFPYSFPADTGAPSFSVESGAPAFSVESGGPAFSVESGDVTWDIESQ